MVGLSFGDGISYSLYTLTCHVLQEPGQNHPEKACPGPSFPDDMAWNWSSLAPRDACVEGLVPNIWRCLEAIAPLGCQHLQGLAQ